LGDNFFNYCANCSRIGVWRSRRGLGGNRETVVLRVPRDVRDLFYLWLERQGSALIQGSAPKKDAARRNPMPVEKE
jgi:hypothetical protein